LGLILNVLWLMTIGEQYDARGRSSRLTIRVRFDLKYKAEIPDLSPGWNCRFMIFLNTLS
jgi:hypothetical protein